MKISLALALKSEIKLLQLYFELSKIYVLQIHVGLDIPLLFSLLMAG
jgi:hypothetical protein